MLVGLSVVTLAQRPDLLVPALDLGDIGAEFMQHDPVAALTRARRLAQRWPDHFLIVLDRDRPVARAVSVPLVFPDPDRPELPDHGWDGVIIWAVEDALDARMPTCVAALDVQVAPDNRGRGYAAAALAALRDSARNVGKLVIPVRPTTKARHPQLSMDDFLARRRPDGLSEDPWLRAHERLGARIVKVAPFSMTIIGTRDQWHDWTGHPLNDGPNTVEGALVPVIASHDLGIYVEPNVWVEHDLGSGA
ncbi:Long-chain-fatty-acid--CoA ligase [Actinosynnema sp. CA-248983]